MRTFERFVPYRERPLCFCDIETTGTTPGVHEVIEIALKHQKLGAFTTQICPEHLDRAQPEALSIARYNTADWVGAPTFREAAPKISEYFADATIVGHNFIGFDVPMLKGNYEMCGLSHRGLFRDVIDTMMLARVFLVKEGLNRLNMEACRKFFGKNYEGAHTAWEDCEFAEELYNDIMDRLRWHGDRGGKKIQETLF
jgi:DNA polymerase III subunit epsilon